MAISGSTLLMPTVYSAVLQISSVSIDMQPSQSAAALTLSNPGEKPLYGQVRIYSWTHTHQGDNSGDVLEPTQAIIASPPMVQIAPGANQLVRLVRTNTTAPTVEQSFRLIIDEIPAPDKTESLQNGIHLRLRYSVPIFVAPIGSNPQPQLVWHVLQREGHWFLQVENRGLKHAQIGMLTLHNAAGQTQVISKGLLGYVLANKEREWLLKEAPPSGAIEVDTRINGKSITASIDHH